MADEPAGGNSPRDTSEATPPHVDDSPEMVNQPSPPEEERVTSSSDHPPPEKVDSPPGEPRVSSTSGQEVNVGAGPSQQEPGAGPSSPDNAPAIANQPSPDGPPHPVLRDILEAPPRPPPSTTRREQQVSLQEVGEAVEAAKLAVGMKPSESGQAGSAQKVTMEANKQNTDKTSDDSNQQFDVEDLSPGSRSSENVDLESDSSPLGLSVHGEESKGSGSSANDETATEDDSSPSIVTVIETESSYGSSAKGDAGMESGSSPNIVTVIETESSSGSSAKGDASMESGSSPSVVTVIEAESNSGIDVPEDAGSKSESSASETGTIKHVVKELSPSKTSLTVPGFEVCSTDNGRSKKELSPSKIGSSSLQGSGSATEKPRDNVSPKRKSPTKVDHLSPKRNAPFTDNLQKQSESQMSTLLEELDIEETKDKPGSSNPISDQKHESMDIDEYEEIRHEETVQESDMEVHETDSQKEGDETIEKDSKKDSEKDDAE